MSASSQKNVVPIDISHFEEIRAKEGIEKYDVVKTDAITGGGTSSGTQTQPGANIIYETSFTSFALEGFQIDSHLWVLFRIIPSNYVTNARTNSQEYPVDIWYNRSVPPPPEFGSFASKPYAENSNAHPQYELLQHTSGKESPLFNTQMHQEMGMMQSPEQQLHREYMERYIEPLPSPDLDDPKLQKIRNELKAEVQRTIANELAKLKLFLSKYYLKDVIKIN
ncbi:5007_t:CDS:2 [Racocetra fulgida]|uniref:5007_t:CDS:1 n=1 Tax=Racocetra fulgida TaxID=60492 RepID=A0A9N8Z2G0_9GLOM|nr:5007_t:CDS:2 [Racocetra fulgida]